MLKWFKQLDQILRGDATDISALEKGKIDMPIGGLTIAITLLGIFYGLCMGSYSVIRGGDNAYMQIFAAGVKLPLLFFLTLLVTFPSLYVFNALVGSRLSISSVLRLLVACMGVMLAVLASLGPIVVFFSLCTESYSFMKLLNVVVATISGFLGLAFLLRTLHRLVLATVPRSLDELIIKESQTQPVEPKTESNEKSDDTESAGSDDKSKAAAFVGKQQKRSALDRVGPATHDRARTVFQIWVVVFALVGAQMSWVLRPFIGSPGQPFTWFRERGGNFFLTIFDAINNLIS